MNPVAVVAAVLVAQGLTIPEAIAKAQSILQAVDAALPQGSTWNSTTFDAGEWGGGA